MPGMEENARSRLTMARPLTSAIALRSGVRPGFRRRLVPSRANAESWIELHIGIKDRGVRQ